MNKIINIFLTGSLIILAFLILALSIRGIQGSPVASELNNPKWIENGPFELSPERGRFALLYSLVENKTLFFTNEIGKFSEPDVAISQGRYVSLFAPLLSFIAIPGYLIGKYFGASQVGTFAVVSFFAVLNLILVRLIAIRLGASSIAASIASFTFLFGTPSFAYAVSLYQHHISTFIVLLSIWALIKSKKSWSIMLVFFLCGAAISLDYPNLFFMFPIGLFALGRIITFKKLKRKLTFKLNLVKMLTPIVMIIPILFFLMFNQASYGNPFQLSGTLQTTKGADSSKDLETIEKEKIQSYGSKKKSPITFFETRNLLNGFYIHFISPDRGIIFYAPVVLFGIIGFFLAFKRKVLFVPLITSVIGINILLYSMWGDPWGGWAFGSRYLIPSYALFSVFTALLLTYWRRKILFIIPFIVVTFYSIAVNTLGAITTSAMPPKAEILALEQVSGIVQRYTYQRNWEFLLAGNTKSFAYDIFLKNFLSPIDFYKILTISIFSIVGMMILYLVVFSQKKGSQNV